MESLKILRKEKNLKQKDLADFLNIAKSTYCGWEKNISQPSIENLIKLANYFECSVDYIIGRANEADIITIQNELSNDEQELLNDYRKLNRAAQSKVRGYQQGLLSAPFLTTNQNKRG